MNIILFLILLAIVFAVIFVFRGWPFSSWRDGYKNAGVRMSFVEFRRIYELAPSKWRRYGDYTYRRDEWIPNPESGFPETNISTSIAMKTLFDFLRLLLWLKRCVRQCEREKRFKEENICLKNLSIMIEKDAENIRKEIEKKEQEAEELRQKIIDRLGGNK
nr:MAG TPA: hypothetical protein [Caudoviricetes sp.]